MDFVGLLMENGEQMKLIAQLRAELAAYKLRVEEAPPNACETCLVGNTEQIQELKRELEEANVCIKKLTERTTDLNLRNAKLIKELAEAKETIQRWRVAKWGERAR